MEFMSVRSFLLRAALSFCVVVSLAQRAPSPVHLVIVSVDGLMPSAYTGPDAARLPTLHSLAREGAYAEGVVGVVPTVTYASHVRVKCHLTARSKRLQISLTSISIVTPISIY